jgi:mannose-6-phosphate isomerase-like protein (cupin superfamily)
MQIRNKATSKTTGQLATLTSWMLISPQDSSARGLSLQISEIPVGSEQPTHSHEPEQCYYLVKGKGLMIVDGEEREVAAGDAVYIPARAMHGIRNIGSVTLEYVTANTPAFDAEYEKALWPADPQFL